MVTNSEDLGEELNDLRGMIGDFRFDSVMYLGTAAQGDLRGQFPKPKVDYLGMINRAPLATGLSSTEMMLMKQQNAIVRVPVSELGGGSTGGSTGGSWPLTGDDALEHYREEIVDATTADIFGNGFMLRRTASLRSSGAAVLGVGYSTHFRSEVQQNAFGWQAANYQVLAFSTHSTHAFLGFSRASPGSIQAFTLGSSGGQDFFGGQAVQANAAAQTYKDTYDTTGDRADVAAAYLTADVGEVSIAQLQVFAIASQATTKRDSGVLIESVPIYMRQVSRVPSFGGPASTASFDSQLALYVDSTAAGHWKLRAKFKNGTIKTIVAST